MLRRRSAFRQEVGGAGVGICAAGVIRGSRHVVRPMWVQEMSEVEGEGETYMEETETEGGRRKRSTAPEKRSSRGTVGSRRLETLATCPIAVGAITAPGARARAGASDVERG